MVAEQSNQCGGGDDLDYASGAKLLNPGESYNPQLSLDSIINPRDYYFKIVVYFGTEKSGASQLFAAVAPGTTPPSTGGDTGGGGGVPVTPEVVEGKPYLFNVNTEILAVKIFRKSINQIVLTIASNVVRLDFESLDRINDEIIVDFLVDIEDFSSIKGEKQALLEYSVQNPGGKIYVSQFEEIIINNKTTLQKEIRFPADIVEVGDYLVLSQIIYQNETFVGRDILEISKESKISSAIKSGLGAKILIWAIVGVLIILVSIILIKRRRKHHALHYGHHGREDLNKLARYVRGG